MNSANPTFFAETLNRSLPERERVVPRPHATLSPAADDSAALTATGAASETAHKPGRLRRFVRGLLHDLYEARMRQAEREIARMHLRLGEDHPTMQAYRAAIGRATRS